MNREALFCDGTGDYVCPAEPEINEKEDILRYCFEIKQGAEICFYSRYGITGKKENYYDFIISPGFKTPEWAKGAVMYQIFVDRFYNGDPTNDVEDNEYIYIGAPLWKDCCG